VSVFKELRAWSVEVRFRRQSLSRLPPGCCVTGLARKPRWFRVSTVCCWGCAMT